MGGETCVEVAGGEEGCVSRTCAWRCGGRLTARHPSFLFPPTFRRACSCFAVAVALCAGAFLLVRPSTACAQLVLLGDSGVGKSCIVLRFVKGQFDPSSKVTVGAAFLSQTVALADSTTVKFEIWDTAGQERYASLAPLYYRGASAAAVVFDITSAESLTKAKFWVKELQKHASAQMVIALVGNKIDLTEQREVSREEAEQYVAEVGEQMFYLETSAKTADGISSLFEAIAQKLAAR